MNKTSVGGSTAALLEFTVLGKKGFIEATLCSFELLACDSSVECRVRAGRIKIANSIAHTHNMFTYACMQKERTHEERVRSH